MAKTERLYLRATPELKEKIEKQAEKENRTMSNWIESVILQKLEEKGENEMKNLVNKTWASLTEEEQGSLLNQVSSTLKGCQHDEEVIIEYENK